MKGVFLCAVLLGVLAAAFLAGRPLIMAQQPASRPDPKGKLEAVKKELADLQRQMEALRQKEKALSKEVEEASYYTKVEVKGRLQPGQSGGYVLRGFTLVGPEKEKEKFQQWLKANVGKTVLVEGTLEPAVFAYPPYPAYMVPYPAYQPNTAYPSQTYPYPSVPYPQQTTNDLYQLPGRQPWPTYPIYPYYGAMQSIKVTQYKAATG